MERITRHTCAMLMLFFTVLPLHAQNFIGMHKDGIAVALKQQNPDFRKDNASVNNTYHYLKFVDNISDQTMLFFLSENDICIYVRWMSDYSNLTEITDMLNRKYKKSGVNRWTYSDGGKRYGIMLEEGEWFFTINIDQE